MLPLSGHLGQLPDWASITLTWTAIVMQCVGLAGLLWANSRGWRPNPRHLFLAACVIVAIMVFVTPVGSSDTANYAAYGRMANLGIDPYGYGPGQLGPSDVYTMTVGQMWRNTPSVYGPLATWLQQLAALFGGSSNPAAAVSFLMIMNGLVFLGVGYFLMRTADDPVRASLMWVANPVLIQQLVGGGHLDTYVAAATVVGIQLARSRTSGWRYLWVGVAIGIGCCFKINAGLAGVGRRLGAAHPARMDEPAAAGRRRARHGRVLLLLLRPARLQTGAAGLQPGRHALALARLPARGRMGVRRSSARESTGQRVSTDIISISWPILMVLIAYAIYRRFGADQPAVVTVPFALSFAWILVAPWSLPWYAAVAWVILALVPRNPMTRWLTLATVYLALMHCSGGGPATWANN